MNDENRVMYLDVLRVVATIAVIVIHVSCGHWFELDYNSYEWQVLNFWDACSRWAVPIFFMVSGALLLDSTVEKKGNKYVLNKIKRLLVAFVAWSFVYALYFNLFNIEGVLVDIIKGPLHFWFIFSIIGIYLVLPILRNIVNDERSTRYFIILGTVFNIILPFILETIPSIAGDVVLNNSFYSAVMQVYYHLKVYPVMGYVLYFVLGYYMKREYEKHVSNRIIVVGIIGVVATVVGTYIISLVVGTPSAVLYEYFSPTVFGASIGVYELAKRIATKQLKRSVLKYIVILSRYSFSIFLSHYIVVKVVTLSWLKEGNLTFNPAFSVPFITVLVFAVSLGISIIIDRIPVLRKYLI